MSANAKHLHSIDAGHYKNTAGCETEVMPVPDIVKISMSQHIGAPCKPLVAKGDTVKVGQLIGDTDAFVSAPIHSSVSGTVVGIETQRSAVGGNDTLVVIETDKKQEMCEDIKVPEVDDLAGFVKAVRESGLVGLGGASFPTHIKYNPKNIDDVHTLILNAAECEPFITSDHRGMLEDTQDIIDGMKLIMKYLNLDEAYVGIESNKPDAIAKLDQMFAEQGQYFRTGVPLINKRMTVDGDAVAQPKNIIAPIGTQIHDVIEFCGGYKSEPKKIIMGGPMMGRAIFSDEMPIVKNNNAILAFSKAYERRDAQRLSDLQVMQCMECGSCSYVCPARRPLGFMNKLGKGVVKEAGIK